MYIVMLGRPRGHSASTELSVLDLYYFIISSKSGGASQWIPCPARLQSDTFNDEALEYQRF